MATTAVLPSPLPTILIVDAGLTLVVALAIVVTANSPGIPEEGLVYGVLAMVAILISQAGFLSCWAVWAPQPPWVRICVSLLATLALYVELLVILLVSIADFADDANILFTALFVPLIFLSSLIPQWLLKFAFALQTVRDRQSPPAETGARRFTLAELFGATAAVAASLGAIRVGITLLDPAGASEGEMLLVTLTLLGAAAGFGLLLCVPCTWAVLIARDVLRGVAALTGYGAVLCSAWCVTVLASMDFRVGPGELGWTLLLAIALVGGPLFGLSVSLAALRSAGYRIRKVETPATPDQGARFVPPRPGLAPAGDD